MRIEVCCPECTHIIKIDIKKVERLEARIRELEAELARLYGKGNKNADVDALRALFGMT